MRCRRKLFLVLALAVPLLAEEKPAGNVPGSSISAAKRDLEAVKAARDATLPAKDLSPQIAAPEIQMERAGGPEAWLKKQSELEKEKKRKSANWLVDAVENEKRREQLGASAGSRESLIELDRDARLLPGASLASNANQTGEDRVAAATGDGKKESEARPTPPVTNPLTRFMADWMTPQDLALLQMSTANNRSTTDSSAMVQGQPAGGAAVNPIAPTTMPSATLEGSLGALGLGVNKNSSSPVAAPRENPFLQSMGGSDAPSVTFSAPVMIPPPAPGPAAASIFSAPPIEPPPARTSIPDFARPSEDAKAFKPMKRF